MDYQINFGDSETANMSPAISFSASANTSNKASKSVYTRPQKKKMSITQTYFLAHSARGKLSREAARPDHDLRLLVGHANMLDSLMIDLANAEQEQERWFNRSVVGADAEEEDEPAHPDIIVEEPESDWEVEDATTSEDESEDEQQNSFEMAQSMTHSPPELTSDSDSDSDDDNVPASPEGLASMVQHPVTASYYEVKETSISETESESMEKNGFYVPSRSQPTIIAAY